MAGPYGLGVFWGRPSGILWAAGANSANAICSGQRAADKIDALAMTEPDAGSDVRGMKAAARRDGGDCVLNGIKHFISHADIADFVDCLRDDRERARPKEKITAFLVDRGTPGFSIQPGYRSVSHRGYQNCVLAFEDCRLPDAQVLGEVDRGFAVANDLVACNSALRGGNLRRSRPPGVRSGVAITPRAQQFGQMIGKFQGVTFKLADMVTEIDAAD